MKAVEALEYYRINRLQGDQAIKIDDVPGAVGVTSKDGKATILVGPTVHWEIASTTGSTTTASQFLLTPGK